jgi:hypothetical protein
MRERLAAAILCTVALSFPVAGWGEDGRKGLPPDFRQLLPRGRIAGIDSPRFVSASEAKIPDDAWVLGILIDGEARAYSLNLLNQHEVVNDRVGERSFAAVW